MKFKLGDKVWVSHPGCEHIPRGTYAAVIVCEAYWYGIPLRDIDGTSYWTLDIEDVPPRVFDGAPWAAPERAMWPRDDPPPQQEPKREELGSWDECPWQPALELMWSELLSGKRGNRL